MIKKIWAVWVLLIFELGACASSDEDSDRRIGNQLVNTAVIRHNVDARIYKRVDGQNLQLHIFYPEGYSADSKEKYRVALSIYGGGLKTGRLEWGYDYAKFMTSMGYVGIAMEYRLADEMNVSALDCIKDANSAVRWIRTYAEEINVDPEQVLAIGFSAGGYLSITTAMFPQFKEESEDETVSSVPNAVIALAPSVDMERVTDFENLLLGQATAKECSPADHVRFLGIPILIVHGSEDELLPIAYTQVFVTEMKAAGNDIELYIFCGGSHEFYYNDDNGIEFWKEHAMDFIERL